MKTRTRIFRRVVTVLALAAVVMGIAGGLAFGPAFLGQFMFKEGLRTLNGEPVESIEDFLPEEAALAYVVLYDTECSACTQYLKELYSIDWDQFGGRVAVVLVNLGGSEHDVRRHLEENGIQTSAQFPVLIGMAFDPEKLEAVPTTFVLMNDGEAWRSTDGQAGAQSSENIVTLTYKMLLRAWGGMDFWEGSLQIKGWAESNGHHTTWAVYTGEYDPSIVEIAQWLDILLRAAELTPNHGLYVHVLGYDENYGYYIAFSLYTDYAHAQGFYVPEDEAAAEAVVNTYFYGAAGEMYYWLDGQIPTFDGTEEAAWHYARYAAIIAGQGWVEELGEVPEAEE